MVGWMAAAKVVEMAVQKVRQRDHRVVEQKEEMKASTKVGQKAAELARSTDMQTAAL
jgi:hypothetical protein